MPVTWSLDAQKKAMQIVGEGDVTRVEVDALLDALLEHEALGYRKLVDAARADTSMTPDELLQLGIRVRSMHGMGKMGPLAMVVPLDRGAQAELLIGMIAAADRPMRVFRDLRKARQWLGSQSPAAG